MPIEAAPILNWKMPPRFIERVSMENCWDLNKSEKAVFEYKKFMILATISPTPVTPSDEIDQIWHLHIVHMRDYSQFCKLLGKDIIHGPTEGGEIEDARYLKQYQYLDLIALQFVALMYHKNFQKLVHALKKHVA